MVEATLKEMTQSSFGKLVGICPFAIPALTAKVNPSMRRNTEIACILGNITTIG